MKGARFIRLAPVTRQKINDNIVMHTPLRAICIFWLCFYETIVTLCYIPCLFTFHCFFVLSKYVQVSPRWHVMANENEDASLLLDYAWRLSLRRCLLNWHPSRIIRYIILEVHNLTNIFIPRVRNVHSS